MEGYIFISQSRKQGYILEFKKIGELKCKSSWTPTTYIKFQDWCSQKTDMLISRIEARENRDDVN